MTQFWVLIETGANQKFVFGTNKRRANIGGSHIIHQVGTTWVADAVREHQDTVCAGGCRPPDDGMHVPAVAREAAGDSGHIAHAGAEAAVPEVVVGASGKALLLVPTRDCGKDVIGRVTERALREAPGLGVWGAVVEHPNAETVHGEVPPGGSAEDVCRCAGCQLRDVHALHGAVRMRAGHPDLRFPSLPIVQPCAFTGRPSVTNLMESGRLRPMGAAFEAAFEAGSRRKGRNAAMERLHKAVCVDNFQLPPSDDEAPTCTPVVLGDGTRIPCPVQTDLDPASAPPAGRAGTAVVKAESGTDPDRFDPVRNAGWIAIIHADGNGIGKLFLEMGQKFGAEVAPRMRAFSAALDKVTSAAVEAAARATSLAHAELPSDTAAAGGRRFPTSWLLPVVIGGDDVSVICDGRLAMDFTVNFIREFAARAAADPDLEGVRQIIDPDRPITASAGIAYIKPHHPFSDGYELAEQLCSSAKQLVAADPSAGTLDFHVLFDSLGRDREEIRRALVVDGTRLWCGPVSVAQDGEGFRGQGEPDEGNSGEGESGGELESDESASPPIPTIAILADAVAAFAPEDADDRDGEQGKAISRRQAHDLRSALLRGGPALQRERARIELRGGSGAADVLNRFVRVEAPLVEPGSDRHIGGAAMLSYVIDALALVEVQAGEPIAAGAE